MHDAKWAAWLTAGWLALAAPAPQAAEDAAAPAPPVEAAVPPAEASAPEPEPERGALHLLDKSRDYLSEHFVNLSTRMDAFFADERIFDEARKSFLRVYGDLSYEESRASDFSIHVQAKVILPGLERRLHVLIESDDTTPGGVVEQSNTIQTVSGVPNVNVPKGFRAALQMLVADSPYWNISTDGGARIHSFRPDLFVRARVSRLQDFEHWQLRLTNSLYWFEQSGAGATILFDADRRLQQNRLFRARSVATWSDHDQKFDYEQSFFIFQPIDVDNAMSYQLSIFGANQPNTHVISYNIAPKWRHRLHREWLFMEIQPLLSWSEDHDFHPTTSILFRLEAVLGGVGCGCYGL